MASGQSSLSSMRLAMAAFHKIPDTLFASGRFPFLDCLKRVQSDRPPKCSHPCGVRGQRAKSAWVGHAQHLLSL